MITDGWAYLWRLFWLLANTVWRTSFHFFSPLNSYSFYFIVIDKSSQFSAADNVFQLTQITTRTEEENATFEIPEQTNIWHLFITKLTILTIMTWDYNQESVFLQMDILGMRKRRQRCFESSVAVLLPQLLHYSPSVEEWYHQMRSSLYLFSLLFSLTDTELPRITEITRTPITAKYFTESFWPCAVKSLTSLYFCWPSGSSHRTKLTSPVVSWQI